MAKKIYISAIVGGIIVLGIYYFLGGFEKVTIEEAGPESFRIAGRYFHGKYDDRSVRQNFMDAKALITSGAVEGDLCVVAFKSDTLQDEYISQFIGVILRTASVAVPEKFEERLFDSDHTARAILQMHPMARPNPEELQEDLSAFMIGKSWKAPQTFVEVYKPDNSMIIYALED